MSEEHDETPLDLDALGWTVSEGPPNFPERVSKALSDQRPKVRRPTPWRLLSFAASTVALLCWFVLRFASPSPSPFQGERLTTQRERIQLQERGVAIAEAGTQIAWTLHDSGEAEIWQTRGRVFYRVDKGGVFVVKTPAGEVKVTGTCFEVELETMPLSPHLRAGTIGATLATALVVSVYEGSVVLANADGQVEVRAGELARAQDGHSPRLDSSSASEPGASLATAQKHRELVRLQTRVTEQRSEILQLQNQVRSLGGQPSEAPSSDGPVDQKLDGSPQDCALQHRPNCPLVEPSREHLIAMARCGTLKVDYPGFYDDRDEPSTHHLANRLGITDPDEAEKLQRAALAHLDAFGDELRQLCKELGADENFVETASLSTLEEFVLDQFSASDMGDMARKLAEERAGLRERPGPDSEQPVEERLGRLLAERGNAFERDLAREVGAKRARSLRKVNNGWPGHVHTRSGYCRDPEEAEEP